MKNLTFVFICLSLLFFVSCAEEQKKNIEKKRDLFTQPDASTGFHWKELEDINMSVQVPNGWLVSRHEKEGTIAYKITSNNTFDTGLTINVHENISEEQKDFSEKTGIEVNAHVYSIYAMNKYKANCDKILDEWQKDILVFHIQGCEAIREINNKKYHIRAKAVANKKNDIFYFIIFGAPIDEWSNAWIKGEVMLNPLMISYDY